MKVLGQGDLSIALNVTADKFSASAQKKIEAAGGSVTLIEKKKWVRDRTAKPKKTKKEVAAPEAIALEETTPEATTPEPAEPRDTESKE